MSKKLIVTMCVGVLSLSALALASSASAVWMVNGTNLSGTEKLATTAAVDENGLLKGAGVTITCTSKTLEGVSPEIEGAAPGDKGKASSLVFKECAANANCTLATKTIGTLPLTATATLGTSPAVNVLFKPTSGTIFTTIKFNGAECALLGTQPVTGQAKIAAPTGQTEKTIQEIAANVTEASGELKIGSSPAELKGAALLQLSTSKGWSFL